MKKIVSAVIISSFLLGVGVVNAAEKKSGGAEFGPAGETPVQTQLRQEYLATLEHARLEYLAAEKKARAELKTASKSVKGKKAGARKKAAQKAYDAAMKKIRKEFVAAKNAAKKEYAAAKEGGKEKEEKPKESTPQAAAPQPAAPAPAASAPTIVTYSSSGFSPSDLAVKSGTTVTFKNEAEDRLWVASDPHPSHTTYPEFDDKKGIEKGGEYTFTFAKAGEWRYHNHLNPGKRGSVKVE